MSLFTGTVDALLRGDSVRATWLFRFDFASQTMRVWPGFGDLVAGGFTWQGLGRATEVSDMALGPGFSGDAIEITLSGVDAEIAALALDQSDEVYGRRALIYAQALGADWAPIDAPVIVYGGVMDTMKVSLSPSEGTIKLRLESILAAKYRPPYGSYTHFDQQKRHAGDNGLERVAILVDHTASWP